MQLALRVGAKIRNWKKIAGRKSVRGIPLFHFRSFLSCAILKTSILSEYMRLKFPVTEKKKKIRDAIDLEMYVFT